MSYKVNQKIKFTEEKQRYKIKAISKDKNFMICTKPMNAHKTVLYTIVDFKRNIRGTDNLVFGMGYETDEQIKESIKMIDDNEMEVSHRQKNYIPLNIEVPS